MYLFIHCTLTKNKQPRYGQKNKSFWSGYSFFQDKPAPPGIILASVEWFFDNNMDSAWISRETIASANHTMTIRFSNTISSLKYRVSLIESVNCRFQLFYFVDIDINSQETLKSIKTTKSSKIAFRWTFNKFSVHRQQKKEGLEMSEFKK